MKIKKKLLLSPLFVIALIVLFGVGIAGAAIYFGTSSGGETNTTGINLQKGLVGWWDFNGNAKDSTPNSNHGTVTGATLTTDRKGQLNKAYSFDGTFGTNLDMGDNLELMNLTGLSISAWVNGSSWLAYGGIVAKLQGNGNYRLIVNSTSATSSVLQFGIRNTAGTYQSFVSATALNKNQWYHVVATFDDAATGKIYINGALDNTKTDFSITRGDTSSHFYVGWNPNNTAGFVGSIDDVRVYNRALSAAEIAALYGSYDPSVVISDSQKGLVGSWDFNGNAKDITPNSYHGTVTGATLTTDRKGQLSKAYSFNGTSNKISIPRSQIFATANMTISAWINANNFTQWKGLIYLREDDTSNYLIIRNNGSALQLLIEDDNVARVNMATSALPTSSWIQVVFTQDGGGWKFYLNGQQGTFTGTNSAYSSDHLTINNIDIGYSAWAESYFSGSIDDVRVYNRALSATEVTDLYSEYDPSVVVSDLQKGLVGSWDFDGNVKDITPNSNHGTITGATLTTDRKGQLNKAYSFNGTSDYIDGGNGTVLQITGNISLSAWIKTNTLTPPGYDGLAGIIGKGTYGASGYGINQRNNKINLGYHGSGNFNSNASLTAGVWYHIVGTINTSGNVGTIYINGQLDSTGSVGNSSTTTNFMIGNTGTAANWFNGIIDDVRIYNRILSEAEITALYEGY